MQAGGHLLLFLATGLLVYLFWSTQLWLGFAVALFLHGTFASFIPGLATHELNHGTVFRTRWLNKAFLYRSASWPRSACERRRLQPGAITRRR